MIAYEPLFGENTREVQVVAVVRSESLFKYPQIIKFAIKVILWVMICVFLLAAAVFKYSLYLSFIILAFFGVVVAFYIISFKVNKEKIIKTALDNTLKYTFDRYKTLQITYQFSQEKIILQSTDRYIEYSWEAFRYYDKVDNYIYLMSWEYTQIPIIVNINKLNPLDRESFFSMIKQLKSFEDFSKMNATISIS